MNCDRCGQVMRESTHYWGKYCQGESCFNSELARLIYGARYKREGEQVRELEKFLDSEGEWLLDKLFTAYSKDGSPANRNYYQGRLDQLAQVRRFLGQPQIMRERESAR